LVEAVRGSFDPCVVVGAARFCGFALLSLSLLPLFSLLPLSLSRSTDTQSPDPIAKPSLTQTHASEEMSDPLAFGAPAEEEATVREREREKEELVSRQFSASARPLTRIPRYQQPSNKQDLVDLQLGAPAAAASDPLLGGDTAATTTTTTTALAADPLLGGGSAPVAAAPAVVETPASSAWDAFASGAPQQAAAAAAAAVPVPAPPPPAYAATPAAAAPATAATPAPAPAATTTPQPQQTTPLLVVQVSDPVRREGAGGGGFFGAATGGGTHVEYLVTTATSAAGGLPGWRAPTVSVRRRFRDAVALADLLKTTHRGYFVPPR
jgi:hypothetical protein